MDTFRLENRTTNITATIDQQPNDSLSLSQREIISLFPLISNVINSILISAINIIIVFFEYRIKVRFHGLINRRRKKKFIHLFINIINITHVDNENLQIEKKSRIFFVFFYLIIRVYLKEDEKGSRFIKTEEMYGVEGSSGWK